MQNLEIIKENIDKFKYMKPKNSTLKDPTNKVKRHTAGWEKDFQHIWEKANCDTT